METTVAYRTNQVLTGDGVIEPCKWCGAMPFYRARKSSASIGCNCGMQTRTFGTLGAAIEAWNGTPEPPAPPLPRADLEAVLAFVLRLGTQFPGQEYPPHVLAAIRLRRWLEGEAQA
jgi:hypothetical protein